MFTSRIKIFKFLSISKRYEERKCHSVWNKCELQIFCDKILRVIFCLLSFYRAKLLVPTCKLGVGRSFEMMCSAFVRFLFTDFYKSWNNALNNTVITF